MPRRIIDPAGHSGCTILGTACFITVRAIISHAAAGKRFLRPEFLTPFYFLFVIGLSAWVGKLQGRRRISRRPLSTTQQH